MSGWSRHFFHPARALGRREEVMPVRGATSSAAPSRGRVEGEVMPVDRIVLAVAGRQHGIVTAAQLADGRARRAQRSPTGSSAAGCGARHRGVYLVGPLETPHSAAMAAVLAYGPGALLSHYPAAVLWGLRPPPAHVTARHGRRAAASAAATGSARTARPISIPPTPPAATASPSPHPPAPSSTSPPPSPRASSTEPPTRPASSASSQTIPSMSSSPATRTTAESRRCDRQRSPSPSSPAPKPSTACSSSSAPRSSPNP